MWKQQENLYHTLESIPLDCVEEDLIPIKSGRFKISTAYYIKEIITIPKRRPSLKLKWRLPRNEMKFSSSLGIRNAELWKDILVQIKFMASTSDIRKGLCIKYNHDIYKIIEFLHVKPGKGPAFVRTKLKSVTTGKVVDNTFSAGHKIDDVRVETRSYQFLYNDGETYHFMNTDDYTQIALQKMLSMLLIY